MLNCAGDMVSVRIRVRVRVRVRTKKMNWPVTDVPMGLMGPMKKVQCIIYCNPIK